MSAFELNNTILIVANDSIQIRGLVQGLKGTGFHAHPLPDARSALFFLKDRFPPAVIIDCPLPEISGLQLCRAIKDDSRTKSVFVLLLLNDATDQLQAFESGAADCIIKPFDVRKVVLQIRNLLRSIGESAPSESIQVGDLILDRARHEVRAANKPVQCTPKEFILLNILMERSGRVQTREELLVNLWENDLEIGPRAVDRHVCCLRAKLGATGRYIQTVQNAGYRLVQP
jgi:two-component system, OmpR family, phosphate regulon response regulator PhoB